MKLLWLPFLLVACTATKSTSSINPFDGGQIGCGKMIAYKLSSDKTQYVSIALNLMDLDLKELQSFRVGDDEELRVQWKKFDLDIASTLCNDVRTKRPQALVDEIATEGVLEMFVSLVEIEKSKKGLPYRVTLVLRKAVFEGLTVDYLRIENVQIGWLPG